MGYISLAESLKVTIVCLRELCDNVLPVINKTVNTLFLKMKFYEKTLSFGFYVSFQHTVFIR